MKGDHSGNHSQIMAEGSEKACNLLKALANQDRLMILCNLTEGEKCVSDLENILGIRQPTLSQQLARLRTDELVVTRREGKVIYYSLASDEAAAIIQLLYEFYCRPALEAEENRSRAKAAT